MAAAPRPTSSRLPLERPRDALLGAALALAALAAYLPALGGGRLLDDDRHITRPDLRTLDGLRRIWFEAGATQQYYPVLHSAFWVEHRLWGDSVVGYHLINVLLHACAALLVVALARRLRLAGAWLAGFLFALHPVCVESVAWIAEQKNTLSAVFALAASLAYLRFDEGRRRRTYGLSLGLFALALLSKTEVAPLPAMLLVLVWWRRGRLAWRRDAAPLAPWFALAALAGLVTLSLERGLVAGVGGEPPLSAAGHALVAGRALWFYLGKLVWPAGLTFFYPRWNVDPGAWWQYLYPLGAAAVAAGLVLRARRNRGPLAAFLCFVLALAPVLGFVDAEWFVFSFVADHLQYLACAAVLVPAAAVLASGAARLPPGARRWAGPAAGLLAAALGLLTWRQCRRYGDPVTFYRTAAELNPDSAAAYDNLGVVLGNRPGRLDEAVAAFEEALRLEPDVPKGYEDLGTALLQDPARRAEAAAALETAVRLDPGRAQARDKLGYALSGIPGRLDDAIAQYRASLRIDPDDASIRDDLGRLLLRERGGLREAEAQLEEAVRIDPGLADARDNLGVALQREGRIGEAIAQFREAVRLDSGFAEAHDGLGLALATAGRLGEAIAQFQEAVRLKPGLAGAHNNLGLAWSLVPGRLDDAIAEFSEALRLDPDFAPGWHSLGAALYRAGDFRAAAAAFRRELDLSPGDEAARQALEESLERAGGP